MEQDKSNRIEYIDAMRGMTMILVVYFHVAAYPFGSYEIGYNTIIELFRMPVFFFISGWLFYKVSRIWDQHEVISMLRKKFMVQIIPTMIFMLLYLTIFNLLNLSSFGSDKKGYWFTFVLFEYFVIYILAEALLNKHNTWRGEARVLAVILFFSVSAFYYAKYYTHYSEELGGWKVVLGVLSYVKIRHIIFFWFGTLVRKHFDKFIAITNNSFFMAAILVLFISIISWPAILSTEGVEYFAYVAAGLSGIIIVFTFFRLLSATFSQETWYGRSLQFIGRRTLDIYLIHYFLLPFDLDINDTWLTQSNAVYVPTTLVLSLLVIAICLAISHIIRLSPFLAKYLFGVKAV